jgi:hypothetical protein
VKGKKVKEVIMMNYRIQAEQRKERAVETMVH